LWIVALLCTLIPAVVALAQEDTKEGDAPPPASDTGPAEEPPPLRLEQKQTAPAPARTSDPKWNVYGSDVIQRVYALLRMDERFDHGIPRGSFVKLWISPEGRVVGVQFARSTGDAATDAALRDVIRAGLTLPPPPKDAPMPLNFEITPGAVFSGRASTFGGARKFYKLH
jgi:TonB family protein